MLESHLTRRRKAHGFTPALATEVSTHILETRGSFPERGTFPVCLTEELPALGRPLAGYLCPSCIELKYIGQVDEFSHEPLHDKSKRARNIWTHGRDDHKWDELPAELEIGYYYRPYGQLDAAFVLGFEPGWEPLQPLPSLEGAEAVAPAKPLAAAKQVQGPINRHAQYLAPGANFIVAMGFEPEVAKYEGSRRRLKLLVDLPNASFADSRKSGRQRTMEGKLVRLSGGMSGYLLEASNFAGRDGSDIRQAFVMGYVSQPFFFYRFLKASS